MIHPDFLALFFKHWLWYIYIYIFILFHSRWYIYIYIYITFVSSFYYALHVLLFVMCHRCYSSFTYPQIVKYDTKSIIQCDYISISILGTENDTRSFLKKIFEDFINMTDIKITQQLEEWTSTISVNNILQFLQVKNRILLLPGQPCSHFSVTCVMRRIRIFLQ